MNRRLLILSFLSCCVAVAFCGCGPKAPYELVPIEGVATYQGTPLPVGFIIQFEPTDGSRPSSGIIREGGTFEAVHTASQKGVKQGPCKIRVYWNEPPELKPVPEEFAEMVARFGMSGPDAPEVEIKKKDKKFEVKFE